MVLSKFVIFVFLFQCGFCGLLQAQEKGDITFGARFGMSTPYQKDYTWVRHDNGLIFDASAGYRAFKEVDLVGGFSVTRARASDGKGFFTEGPSNAHRTSASIVEGYLRIKLVPYPKHAFGFYLAGDGGLFFMSQTYDSRKSGLLYGFGFGLFRQMSEQLDVALEIGTRISDPFGRHGSTHETMHKILMTLGVDYRFQRGENR